MAETTPDQTTDTFTDAEGRRFIAGKEVPEVVWERFDRLAAAVERVRALCEERIAETAEGLSASAAGEIQVSVLGATHHAYTRVLAALEGSEDS